ncbi:MAG: copper chaperone PCu(A)C [Gammaproteobacteria bacterium]
MRIVNFPSLFICIVCIFALSACNLTNSNPIEIEGAWIREAPPNATAMAGYMRITNNSEKNIILHSASSPTFKAIEFHRSVEKDGVYRMVPQLHLHINAKAAIELKPGDYHLMMFNPKKALKEGDIIDVNLVFSHDQHVNTAIPVKKAQY